jgi:hypothetical protein
MIKRVLIGILMMSLLSFVSAGITLSEPQEIYNLGDKLYVSASGINGLESGNLNIDLVCNGNSTNLVKISARSFSSEEEQTYSIPYKILEATDLEISDINSLIGSCNLEASLGSDSTSTESFTISDELFISASVDKSSYNPGEPITIIIEATKANGQLLDGFIEGSNGTSFTRVIQDGVLRETFVTPATIEAGLHNLNLRAYTSGNLNKGETNIFYEINQIASSLILSLGDSIAKPGDNFKIGSEVFDQSGKKIEGTAMIKVISPTEEEIRLDIVSGESKEIEFLANATPGIWKVSAFYGELIYEVAEFEVEEDQKAKLYFEGNVLIVENIGNTVYDKIITVKIGEEEETIELKMDMGEIRKFKLKGQGEVTVGDGETQASGQPLLTGNAISIKNFKEGGIFGNQSLWIILLIIVLGVAGVTLLHKYRKTRKLGSKESLLKKFNFLKSKKSSKIKSKFKDTLPFTNKSPSSQSLDSKDYKPVDKSLNELRETKQTHAESSLVLKGEKYLSAILSLNIKNYSDLKANAKKELKRELDESHGGKGLIDWKADHVFVIFSPLITKTYNNELVAAKAGFKLLTALKKYNKKYSDKIDFNIGIHSGELVASKEGNKLKYTSIGNAIPFARRISDSGKGKLLISEEVRKKMLRDLKVTKETQIGEKNIYSVSEIKNKEANQVKLKELLRRMDK